MYKNIYIGTWSGPFLQICQRICIRNMYVPVFNRLYVKAHVRVVLPVRVEGSPDFKGFFVTARNLAEQAVGTMSTADGGHQTMCDDKV